MDVLTLENVVAHAAQTALLAALGTLLAAVARVDSAAVRYGYWRLLLAACLVLPWLQPLSAPAQTAAGTSTIAATLVEAITTTAQSPSRLAIAAPVNWMGIAAAILGLGIVARLLWVGAGLLSLRRLRGLGVGADGDGDVEELQATLRTRADVRYVAGLRQPATFGVRRPVVLLPDSLREDEPAIRRALIAHELFHVQRRDWVWVVLEELVLATLWFNPAVWWLVARVRLSREEAVDELAILATGSRRTYVRALLAYAEDSPLAPAPAFAHRRHLLRRIMLISTEGFMSSRRIVFSCAVMALVLILGGRFAATTFPLVVETPVQGIQPAGPVEKRSNPITATNPIPRRTDYRAADYPAEARALEARGMIHLLVIVDELGRVAETRRLGFTLGTSEMSINMPYPSPENIAAFVDRAILRTQDGRVADARTVMRVVDAFTEAATLAVTNWRYEAPMNGPIKFDVKVHFQPDGETSALQSAGVPPRAPGEPVRVGSKIVSPRKIHDVRPVYPPEAQMARLSGTVVLEIRVGADGAVEEARVLRSIPLLDRAALDAVRQWKYTPTLLNGVPVPVIMAVTVKFERS